MDSYFSKKFEQQFRHFPSQFWVLQCRSLEHDLWLAQRHTRRSRSGRKWRWTPHPLPWGPRIGVLKFIFCSKEIPRQINVIYLGFTHRWELNKIHIFHILDVFSFNCRYLHSSNYWCGLEVTNDTCFATDHYGLLSKEEVIGQWLPRQRVWSVTR